MYIDPAIRRASEAVSSLSRREGVIHFPEFIRREVALMGRIPWTKVLRFVLILLAVVILLAYIAPIKAC